MPHPYAQDDDARINPLPHDDWPEPTPEEIERMAEEEARLFEEPRAKATQGALDL